MTPITAIGTSVAHVYDRWSDAYDEDYASRPETADEDRVVLAWLRSFLRRGASVLDVGCGTGWLLDTLGWPRALYHGFDLSQGMVRHADRKHPAHSFSVGDARLPWPDYPHDWRAGSHRQAVSLWSVVNHLDPDGLVEMLDAFRQSGGDSLAILSRTPNAPGSAAAVRHDDELSAFSWAYAAEDLASVAEHADLSVTAVQGIAYGGEIVDRQVADYLWTEMEPR